MKTKKLVGISTFQLQRIYGDEKALEIASKIGADAIDFDLSCCERFNCENPLSIYSKNDDEIRQYFSLLKDKAEKLGIKISQTHGRLRIYLGNPDEDKIALENARLDCLATSVLGAPYCVMHSIATSVTGPDADASFMHDTCFEVYKTIIGYAKKYGVKIATETMGDSPKYGCCDFFGNFAEFKKMYDRVCAYEDNENYFVICIDTGHCNKAMRFNNNPKPSDFIRAMGDKIKCLHLNDNNTFTDQHKIPMSGDIDWNDVVKALDEVGYDGVYNLELNLKNFGEGLEIEMAEFAIKVMRNMLNLK